MHAPPRLQDVLPPAGAAAPRSEVCPSEEQVNRGAGLPTCAARRGKGVSGTVLTARRSHQSCSPVALVTAQKPSPGQSLRQLKSSWGLFGEQRL
ncbi:hypothetical protein AAFF_G00294580 [Aldrovandia affinis]|uniref:Uncharacterized protein n=1 Tax=Aldrovandia affinis TaxID=143900 RepID=A0AAD7W1T3_9TELE|nr:hypothetical protein AAFF_G00294580 [Aldrovandia affinis]